MKKWLAKGFIAVLLIGSLCGCTESTNTKETSSERLKKERQEEDEAYSSLPSLSKKEAENEAMNALHRYFSILSSKDVDTLKEHLPIVEDPTGKKDALNANDIIKRYGNFDYSTNSTFDFIPYDDLIHYVKVSYKIMNKHNATFNIYSKYTGPNGETQAFVYSIDRDKDDGEFYVEGVIDILKEKEIYILNDDSEKFYLERATQSFYVVQADSLKDVDKEPGYVADTELVDLMDKLVKEYPTEVMKPTAALRLSANEFSVSTGPNSNDYYVKLQEKENSYTWVVKYLETMDTIKSSAGWIE